MGLLNRKFQRCAIITLLFLVFVNCCAGAGVKTVTASETGQSSDEAEPKRNYVKDAVSLIRDSLSKTGKDASDSYIMLFDGKEVSIEDFKFMNMLYGSKQDALDILIEDLTVIKMSTEYGLGLTEDEREMLEPDIQGFKEYLESYGLEVPDVTDERFIDILGMSLLYDRLAEKIEQELDIDEDDLQANLVDFLETGKDMYTDTQMKYCMAETEYDATFAREMLVTGMDADEVIKNYSTGYSEDYGIERISLSMLGLDEETMGKLLALDIGGVSDVIDFNGVYVFFIIDEIYIPDDNELEEIFRADYIDQRIGDVFYQDLDKWMSETEIEINYEAYDAN